MRGLERVTGQICSKSSAHSACVGGSSPEAAETVSSTAAGCVMAWTAAAAATIRDASSSKGSKEEARLGLGF